MGLSDTSRHNKSTTRPHAEKISAWSPQRGRRESIRSALVTWFRAQGRSLPWRDTNDPYAIVVSEFMLQQTQVSTVVPYFERWMNRFPDFQSLASADEQEVLSIWQGLGYYSRARNLHRLAVMVVTEYAGRMPDDVGQLRKLPGIGDYTAAAVAAFAYDQPVPVVDANIARVLARLANWAERIDTAEGRQFLNEAATTLQPSGPGGGRVWNSAIMELGALICRSGQPDCLLCPVKKFCAAENPSLLPHKAPRPVTETRTERVAFLMHDEKVFLTRARTKTWNGLWHMPLIERGGDDPDLTIEYPITKYRVTLEVVRVGCEILDHHALTAFSTDALTELPMPAPHRRAVMKMLERFG